MAKRSEADILRDILHIKDKYLNVALSMRVISISPTDQQRLAALEEELKSVQVA